MGGGDYENVNKAQTQQANTDIQGLQTRADELGQQGVNEANFGRSQMFGPGGGGGFVGQMVGSAEGYDPNAAFRQFSGQVPQLQSMAFGNYSPLQGMLNRQAAQQAEQSIANTASQFADQGALNSGAAAAAMGEAGARPFAQVQNQLGQQQLGLAGNLMGQAQQIAPQQQQFGQETLQRALGQGLQAAGNVYQTGRGLQESGLSAFGQGAGYATQIGQPENVYQPSGFERALNYGSQIANIGSGIAGMASGFGLIGGEGDTDGGGGTTTPRRPGRYFKAGNPVR